MKPDNYYRVYGWMIDGLGLRGAALHVYARIYSTTAAGKPYEGQAKALREDLPASLPSIYRALQDLKERGLLIEDKSGGFRALRFSQNENEFSQNEKKNSQNENENRPSHPINVFKNKNKKEEKEKLTKRKDDANAGAGVLKETEISELFQAFWEAYPKKVGQPKAFAKFKAAIKNREDFEHVMSRLRIQIEQDYSHRDAQYIPNPAMYLYERRWEDEPIKRPGKSYVPQYIYDQEAGQYDDERASEEELEEIRKHMNQED